MGMNTPDLNNRYFHQYTQAKVSGTLDCVSNSRWMFSMTSNIGEINNLICLTIQKDGATAPKKNMTWMLHADT